MPIQEETIINLFSETRAKADRLAYLMGCLKGVSLAMSVLSQFALYESQDRAMEMANNIIERKREEILKEVEYIKKQ